MTLCEKTLHLLKNRPVTKTFQVIADEMNEATGGDTAPNWISMFNCGRIASPSVNAIEALYNVLSDKPLSY